MNSISVENFVGCLQPPLGSRAVRKVVGDHSAVAGDTRRGQGHSAGTRGDAQGAANRSAQHGRWERFKNTDGGDPPWHTERCFSKQAGPTELAALNSLSPFAVVPNAKFRCLSALPCNIYHTKRKNNGIS